jgi:hypothetical protein
MSNYKAAVRHMNHARFLPFLLRMTHLHNCEREATLAGEGKLVQSAASADLSHPPATEPKWDPQPPRLYLVGKLGCQLGLYTPAC